MPAHFRFQYQVKTQPIFIGGEVIFEDKWHQGWSIPVRQARDPRAAIALAASGYFGFPQTTGEIITLDKWFAPWSERNVKTPARLRDGAQQFFAMQPAPDPFVATGWYNWLSEPVRLKPRLPVGEQQA